MTGILVSVLQEPGDHLPLILGVGAGQVLDVLIAGFEVRRRVLEGACPWLASQGEQWSLEPLMSKSRSTACCA